MRCRAHLSSLQLFKLWEPTCFVSLFVLLQYAGVIETEFTLQFYNIYNQTLLILIAKKANSDKSSHLLLTIVFVRWQLQLNNLPQGGSSYFWRVL